MVELKAVKMVDKLVACLEEMKVEWLADKLVDVMVYQKAVSKVG